MYEMTGPDTGELINFSYFLRTNGMTNSNTRSIAYRPLLLMCTLFWSKKNSRYGDANDGLNLDYYEHI